MMIRCRSKSALPAAVLVFSGCLAAALGESPPNVLADAPAAKGSRDAFECRWAESPIKIDGVLDDAAWKHADVIDYFYLPWLGKKARPARTATKAKLLWDREYIYFCAD